MNPTRPTTLLLVFGAIMAMSTPAHAGKAHEHGIAKLDLAVDKNDVSVSLEIPLDALVGFERAPRSSQERQSAESALNHIQQGQRLFVFNAEAQCELDKVTVEAPVLQSTNVNTSTTSGGHADLTAEYLFKCSQPQRLSSVEVRLFDQFRRLERVQVQAVVPGKASKALLRRSKQVFNLSP